MSQESLIRNRQKVQFANALAFAKLLDKGTLTASVSASSNSTTMTGKGYSTPHKVLGWCQLNGDTNWVPLQSVFTYLDDEFGYRTGVFPFSNDKQPGFYIKNVHASDHSFAIKYWLYFI